MSVKPDASTGAEALLPSVSISKLTEYILKLASLLLDDAVIDNLQKKLQEQSSMDLLSKFIFDAQISTLMIERLSIKGLSFKVVKSYQTFFNK